jgi:hypothetical protein
MLVKETVWTSHDERCIHSTWHFNIRCGDMLGNRDSGIWYNGRYYYRGRAPAKWDSSKEYAELNIRETTNVVYA